MKHQHRNKRRANILHFKHRLLERYGIDMGFEEIDRLSLEIKNSNGRFFIKRLTGSRTLYKVQIANEDVLLIYDKNQHSLLTALPPENIDNIDLI